MADLAWQHWSGTTLVNDRFAAEEETLSADNVADLDVKWVYEALGTVSMTPTIADGVVYGVDNGGGMWALNESTGVPLWQHAVEDVTGFLRGIGEKGWVVL